MQEHAVFFVQGIPSLDHGYTLCPVVCSHFHNQHRGNHGILIPNIGSSQIAIAFLKAEYITGFLTLLFQKADLFADELEAGENLDDLNSVFLGDGTNQVSGYDGLDNYRVFGIVPIWVRDAQMYSKSIAPISLPEIKA